MEFIVERNGWPSYKAKPRPGAFRVVAASLPKDHAKALRSYCIREGVPISRLLGELVASWLELKEPLNYSAKETAPFSRSQPVKAETRETTGQSLPVADLQSIDATRQAVKESGPGFAD